jgi:ubiquinone/menaquinone biosynthesis C-methylase UbiE
MSQDPESDHFLKIYRTQAAAYHHMIAAEDVDGNLLPALQTAVSLGGKRVLDLGSGTGRIPILLDGIAGQVIGLDLQLAMLAESRHLRDSKRRHWELVCANMPNLPFARAAFEVAVSGWAIGHTCSWSPQDWPARVDGILAEMSRVTSPGGALIVIETLGTGVDYPHAPTQALSRYYQQLETRWGFQRQVVQTDYQFDSPATAAASTAFFFGPALGKKIRANSWARVPEWTGVWHRQV